MLSSIAAIAKALIQILDLVKRGLALFKRQKRENLVEIIKKGSKSEQLDALDKLRK